MKRVLTIVLCLVLALSCVGMFAACHEHTYDESKWESDGTNHWHPATCEHTDEKSGEAAHVWGTDNKCTVCQREKQSTDPGTDPGGHTHSFAKGWNNDETYHWHDAICGDTTEVDGKEKHKFNEFNKCTVCEYQGEITFGGDDIDAETWAEALEALLEMRNFTAVMEEKYGNDSIEMKIEAMENAVHMYNSQYDIDTYIIFTEEGATAYVLFGDVWVPNSVEDEEFDEFVGDLVHQYVEWAIPGFANMYDEFTYDNTSKAYVWEGSEDGDDVSIEIKFVGSDVYSLKMTSVNTEEGTTSIMFIDAIGNTSFELAPLHKHDFATEWSSNGLYHWHEAVCHEGEVDEKVAHTWGTDNKCTVCDYAKTEANTKVSEEEFVKALSLKGLTNWTLMAYMDGELTVLVQREGDKFILTHLYYGYSEVYEIDADGKVWTYVEVEEDVWEKLDVTAQMDADIMRGMMAAALGNLEFLAESYEEFTYVDGVYKASGLSMTVNHTILEEVKLTNASVEIVFNDGEIVSFKLVDMDGEDELYKAELVIGQTSITMPSATVHEKHIWELNKEDFDEEQHGLVCAICGEKTRENHKFDEDVCEVCGYEIHEHLFIKNSVDEQEHSGYCKFCDMRIEGKHDFSGENGECVVCGYVVHDHRFDLDYVTEKEHYGRCSYCGMRIDGKHDFSGENGKCAVCGYFVHEHEFVLGNVDDNRHNGHCNVCGMYMSAKHQFEGDTCTVCNYQQHEHKWEVTDISEWGHQVSCEICGMDDYDQHDEKGENGACSVCGYKEHEHEWIVDEKYEWSHEIHCNICNMSRQEGHDYEGEDGACTVCGVKEHNHYEFAEFVIDPSDVDLHIYVCECGVILDRGWHNWTDGDGDCEECGAHYHEHDYKYVEDVCEVSYNWHEMYCEECGKVAQWEHEFDSEEDNECNICGAPRHEHTVNWQKGPTYHYGECSVCGETFSSSHEFDGEEDNECNVCGAPRHHHDWQLVIDGEPNYNNHQFYCEECGEYTYQEHVFEENPDVCDICGAPRHEHSVDEWDNNEWRHWGYCSECGYVEKEHEWGEDGKTCTVCGYVKIPVDNDTWYNRFNELSQQTNFTLTTQTEYGKVVEEFSEDIYHYTLYSDGAIVKEMYIIFTSGEKTVYTWEDGQWKLEENPDEVLQELFYGSYEDHFEETLQYSIVDYFYDLRYMYSEFTYNAELNCFVFDQGNRQYVITVDEDGNFVELKVTENMGDAYETGSDFIITYIVTNIGSTAPTFDESVVD